MLGRPRNRVNSNRQEASVYNGNAGTITAIDERTGQITARLDAMTVRDTMRHPLRLLLGPVTTGLSMAIAFAEGGFLLARPIAR